MKVLIIEDSTGDAFLIERLIKRACLDLTLSVIDRVSSVDEAFKMILETDRDYGLITLDDNLDHNCSGMKFLHELAYAHKLDSKYFGKIIGISDDDIFFHYCNERGIATFHKELLIADDRDVKFKPLVKKIVA